MKKLLVILAIMGLLAIIPLGIALAQSTTQTTPPAPNQNWANDMIDYCQGVTGSGGMMGSGMMGGGYNNPSTTPGSTGGSTPGFGQGRGMMGGGGIMGGGGMMGGGEGWGRGMMGW